MYAVFIGVGVLVLASLFRWSAGKVRKKYSCFFFLEFFSGGFALIDTDMWLIVRNRSTILRLFGLRDTPYLR